MPKLKNVRPSAAQARLLFALADNPDLTIMVTDYGYVEWRGGGKSTWEWERIHGKVRSTTASKSIREEWIEQVDAEGDWTQKNTYHLSETGLAVAEAIRPDDMVPQHKGVSVASIHRVLRKRYPAPEWVYLEEVRLGTGYEGFFLPGHHVAINAEQRIDGFAINCYKSKSWRRIAIEIKISRGDFLKEIKNPDKRIGAMMLSNQFYFAAPEGLIKVDELPEDCGLIEVRGDFQAIKVQAAWHEASAWHPATVASVLRSAVRQR
jgi:hypothetical protein